ncbi:uncharacterized protein LOC109533124 [Dendroctonus ponderosae]|uniref:uncharacterized protein LOC109533124 n=1 Tax=Dendroctonus ponderosae TaxID=77166 RepID=UPI002035BF3A|nr:uncharacterized protein LOC109533124 [Dendroctonus ponderosae]KAH1004944.1 hypothetical protein HUJ05_005707 [Dendroctonus ponderosae]
MGLFVSKERKNKRRLPKVSKGSSKRPGAKDSSDAGILRFRDEQIICAIRRDLNETPETFVLNNVLMGTMFLRNYQEEIGRAAQEAKNAQESSFWEPNVVMEKANKNVIYRPIHGRNMAEPLVTRRIYVPMNEYVDVFDPENDYEEPQEHSSSRYQVRIEDSKRPGFVKLQRINDLADHDGISLKDIIEAASSNISGSSDTDSISTSIGTEPQLLKEQNADFPSLDDCFVFRKIKKADVDIQLEDLDYKNLKEEDVFSVVSYLTSRRFMKHFQKQVFQKSIAEQLGISQNDVDHGMIDRHSPGKIFCNVRDENGNAYPVEVLPCLKCPWPYKQTYQFCEGSPGAKTQWPTDKMIDEVKQYQCVLVPKGFSRKRGDYPEGDLEWEIHFPLAERYLEAFLLPEQINCYFVFLAIFKEYIQPSTKGLGVVPEHFLNLILTEAEANYSNWASHQLGPRLLGLIDRFSNILSAGKMRDFFIRRKNVLKNRSAKRRLDIANKALHRIKESPLMMIIRALRNVRYTSGNFYPPLDYKELLRILYVKEWDDMTMTHISDKEDEFFGSVSSLDEKPKFKDAETQLAYVNARRQKQKLVERRKRLNDRKGSVDSINDDWECEKHLDRPKKVALLKLFIKHHLEMANASLRISTETQALFYLKQAWYLTRILKEENPLWADEAVRFLEEIRREESKIIIEMQTNIRNFGSLNVLNLEEERYEVGDDLETLDDVQMGLDNCVHRPVDAEVHQQVRNTKVKLKTLSRSFSNNYFQEEPLEDIR